jgi:hypothetical protein
MSLSTADDADCLLRVTACCECGADIPSTEALIALAGDALSSYVALVCDPEAGCLACETIYPHSVEAFCNDEDRCDIRDSPVLPCEDPDD